MRSSSENNFLGSDIYTYVYYYRFCHTRGYLYYDSLLFIINSKKKNNRENVGFIICKL